MVKGLTAPFDSSMNIENDQSFSKKGSIWREKNVKVDKSAQLQNVVVGSGSVIADGVVLINTLVGRNCSIQSGVVIEDSILWDKATVTMGCKIHQSIITTENEISNTAQLGIRTVLLPKTSLAITIPDNTAFTVYTSTGQPLAREEEDSEDEDGQITISKALSQCSNNRYTKPH